MHVPRAFDLYFLLYLCFSVLFPDCAWWAAFPHCLSVLHMLSNCLTQMAKVTRIWPLTVLGGDQVRPWCGSLTITCTTKLIYKATQGPDFSREKLLPLVLLCLPTVTLHGAWAKWNGPCLHGTTVKHKARTQHVHRTQEDEQWEHCLKGVCAIPLPFFPKYFLLSGPSDHRHWTPLCGEHFSIFSSSSGVWSWSLFTARHSHPVQQCPLGIPQHPPSCARGLCRDAQVTMSPVRWSLSFKKYLAPSNIFVAWRWRSCASQMPWIVQYLCILAK